MKQSDCVNGRQFREMLASGTAWLEKNAPGIDAINVFPVPDGDTGTNMLLTMRSAMEESYRAPDGSASAVSAALAYGALMGARGNSGVILSQVFRGIAQELKGRDSMSAADLALALKSAAEHAYKGLARPVEGTMLTVMRDAADAAAPIAEAADATNVQVLNAAVEAARESVARTPTLLPALREAGVVDAGGQGLFTLLQGALHHLRGEADQLQHKLNSKKVMSCLNRKGQSVVVVGDERMLRVHVHTLNPGAALRYGLSKGTLHQIKIENMDDQHQEFVQARKEQSDAGNIAIVAVASGQGLAEVFQSLGATQIVQGGQTMNPSVRDILKAVESVAADGVIVLPNNKNIVQSANSVPALTSKKVVIVPAESIPQGLAALLSFNFEQDLEQNAEGMKRAMQGVRTVEVTTAVRSTKVGGIEVKKGQKIGLLDDKLVVAGDGVGKVLQETLAKSG